MKYTFETDDIEEALRLIHSGDAWIALREIDNICRSQLKHGSTDNAMRTIERVRELTAPSLRDVS